MAIKEMLYECTNCMDPNGNPHKCIIGTTVSCNIDVMNRVIMKNINKVCIKRDLMKRTPKWELVETKLI